MDEIVIKKGYRRNHLSAILFGLPTPNRMTEHVRQNCKPNNCFFGTPPFIEHASLAEPDSEVSEYEETVQQVIDAASLPETDKDTQHMLQKELSDC